VVGWHNHKYERHTNLLYKASKTHGFCSGYWRDCKLRSLRIRTSHSGHSSRRSQCAYRVSICRTPLSVSASDICSSVLGAYILNERLGLLGKMGCALCLIGAVIIVLHAPPDQEINRIDEMLHLAIQWRESRKIGAVIVRSRLI
jgi:hypothetical protein